MDDDDYITLSLVCVWRWDTASIYPINLLVYCCFTEWMSAGITQCAERMHRCGSAHGAAWCILPQCAPVKPAWRAASALSQRLCDERHKHQWWLFCRLEVSAAHRFIVPGSLSLNLRHRHACGAGVPIATSRHTCLLMALSLFKTHHVFSSDSPVEPTVFWPLTPQ